MEKLLILSLHVVEDYNELTDVVLEVVWQLSKKLPYQGPTGEDMFITVGATTILDDPTPGQFTPYSELAVNDVETWVRSSQEFKDKALELEKEYRARTIFNMVVKDLPWGSNN
jgi:hypothetical protein